MREKLTLILFKDHLTARTLKLPVQWLPRLGLLWLIAMFLTVTAGVFLFRAYFQGSDGSGGFALLRSQSKVGDLEKQLSELKSSYDALQSRTQGGTTTSSHAQDMTGVNFSAFPPASLKSGLPTRDTLPFRLESLKAQWRGNMLQLTTAIEYIRDDGGNQQGHFVILARGPQSFYAYPDGALSAGGTEVLIRPESGEYFSVSRYREIKANFGPALTRDTIQSIELYIFDSQKNLIFVERAGVEAPKTKPPVKAPVSEEPKAEVEVPNGTSTTAPGSATEPAPGVPQLPGASQ